MAKKDNNISRQEWLKQFNEGKKGYVKKPRSWKRTHLWWEPLEDDELWFVNIAGDVRVKGKGTELEDSVWITAKDLETWTSHWERQGYNFYIDE